MSDEKLDQSKSNELLETRPTAVFISGLSGTGKSTLVNYFSENPIEGWGFYDFDKGKYEIPEDESEHLAWRTKQTNYWLEVALQNALEKNIKTAVMGLSLYPETTFELPNANKFDQNDIRFALIHTDDEKRKQRLEQRGTPQHWQGKKDWYDEFYQAMREHGEKEFDTTNQSPEETAQEIKTWLEEIK